MINNIELRVNTNNASSSLLSENSAIKTLIVDDEPFNLIVLEGLLM